MKIPLRETRGSIYEANASFAHPLDVFRVVNVPSSRSWRFRLNFDDKGRNHLRIQSDPPLSSDELFLALDGRMPVLYAYERLVLGTDGQSYETDLSPTSAADERDTEVELQRSSEDIANGELQIIGYPPCPALQRQHVFKKWLRENTWFGSKFYKRKAFSCDVQLMGNKFSVSPRCVCDPVSESVPSFSTERTLDVEGEAQGEVYIVCHEKKSSSIRHARYGEFDPTVAMKNFWKELEQILSSGMCLEISTPLIAWFTPLGPTNYKALNKLLEAVLDKLKLLGEDCEYETFLAKLDQYKKEASAQLLTRRQERLQRSPRISIDNEEYMGVPSCENEVVALYMKIEGAKKLPPHFECKVLEYTSREGIDALADFRFSPGDTFLRTAPVEFEHTLENFFEHKHPPGQTKLIICWVIGQDSIESEDRIRQKDHPWLYEVVLGGHSIPAVVLKHIPNLSIDDDLDIATN